MTIKRPIVFYEGSRNSQGPKTQDQSNWSEEHDKEKQRIVVRMTTSGNKNLPRIMERNQCPQTMTVADLKLFDTMLNRFDRKTIGLEGKLKLTHGLGFEDKGPISRTDDKPSSSKLTLVEAWAARSARDSRERDACDEMNHTSLPKSRRPP